MKAQTRRIQAQRIFPQKLGQDQGGDQESGQSGSGDMQGAQTAPEGGRNKNHQVQRQSQEALIPPVPQPDDIRIRRGQGGQQE